MNVRRFYFHKNTLRMSRAHCAGRPFEFIQGVKDYSSIARVQNKVIHSFGTFVNTGLDSILNLDGVIFTGA